MEVYRSGIGLIIAFLCEHRTVELTLFGVVPMKSKSRKPKQQGNRRKPAGRPAGTRSVDARALEYLELQERSKDILKRLDAMKAEFKAEGPIETENYRVEVVPVTQERMAGVTECISKLGEQLLRGVDLIKTSSYEKVVVKRKLPFEQAS